MLTHVIIMFIYHCTERKPGHMRSQVSWHGI